MINLEEIQSRLDRGGVRAREDESCVFADDIAFQYAAEIERGEHRREEKEE